MVGYLRGRICLHLDKNRLIRDNRHNFVHGWSSLMNLNVFEEVIKVIDEVDVVHMEFHKLFDKGTLARWIQTMHGIHGKFFIWNHNWFIQRRQRVVCGGRVRIGIISISVLNFHS